MRQSEALVVIIAASDWLSYLRSDPHVASHGVGPFRYILGTS